LLEQDVKFRSVRDSSWVVAGRGVVQDEDGLHDRGGAAWTAAEFCQDFPGLESGDCAFAASADLRMRLVDGLLPPAEVRPVAVAFERGTDAAAGALVALAGKGLTPTVVSLSMMPWTL
jgi:hypothetical protein